MENNKKYLKRIGIFLCSVFMFMGFMPMNISAADMNFNKAATIVIDGTENVWVKYKAPDNGYITITAANVAQEAVPGFEQQETGFAAGVFRLYDSKKKSALTNENIYNTASANSNDYTITYGVKKNTTYYLRVKPKGAVSVRCKLTKISESSGSKKSKAKSITKNKTVKGIIPAGDKTEDWYKIKITKKQTLHLYYSGKTNEQLRFTFSGTYLKTTKKYVKRGVTRVYHIYSTERVQPGTYYVKVERYNSKSSGYYTLKWK